MNDSNQISYGQSRLYRNKEKAWLGGVCAGLADKHGMSVGVVRLITFLLLFTFVNFIVVIAYLICWAIVPAKPADLYHSPEEAAFRTRMRYSPSDTFGNLRHRFRDMERRMQRMEAYLTSKEYELDRELGKR